MTARQCAELLTLAALWGASFLFMRVAVPEFGPVMVTEIRVLLASLALAPLLWMSGHWRALRAHAGPLVVVGLVNSALPFALYSYALLWISTGLAAIFNATAPLWGALIAWAWLGERLNPSRVLGLVLGFAGVVWLAWDQAGLRSGAGWGQAAWAVVACLVSTFCYGFSVNFTKRHLGRAPPMAVAAGSQMVAGLALAIPAAATWPAATPSPGAWAAVTVLGLACTGLAYWLYFRLIASVGPSKALAVAYLIPLFALVWGWLFLGEGVTPVMVGAGSVILLGTALATGLIGTRATGRP
jgi:drug/metabolite transporter (DMT)-like permease